MVKRKLDSLNVLADIHTKYKLNRTDTYVLVIFTFR